MDWSVFMISVFLIMSYIIIESLVLVLKDIEIGIKNNLESIRSLHRRFDDLQEQNVKVEEELEEFPLRKELPPKPLVKTGSSMNLKQLLHNKFYHNN